MKYLEAFKPYLSSGLQNFEDHQVNLSFRDMNILFVSTSSLCVCFTVAQISYLCYCGNY